jgi:hypothetical protein
MNIVVCGKCGRTEEYSSAVNSDWLIAQRQDKPEGHLIIRCPEHITDYARRLAGQKQQRHHINKKTVTFYNELTGDIIWRKRLTIRNYKRDEWGKETGTVKVRDSFGQWVEYNVWAGPPDYTWTVK